MPRSPCITCGLAAGADFGAGCALTPQALLSLSDVACITQLADDALAAGATSGADRVAGLLFGLSAWLACDSDERSA